MQETLWAGGTTQNDCSLWLLGFPLRSHDRHTGVAASRKPWLQWYALHYYTGVQKFGLTWEFERQALVSCVARFASDEQWAETGDRYLLKLLRDYLFHQVHPSGAPWINLAHVVQTINKVNIKNCKFSWFTFSYFLIPKIQPRLSKLIC